MTIEDEKTGLIHLGSYQALCGYYCAASNYYYSEIIKTGNPIKKYFLNIKLKFYQYLWVDGCNTIKKIQKMDEKIKIQNADIFNISNQIGKD